MEWRRRKNSTETAAWLASCSQGRAAGGAPACLRRFLAEEADKVLYRTKTRDEAHQIFKYWADLEQNGYLAKKETALDNGFLEKVFGDALGYRSHPENPEEYQLEVKFSVPGVGTADAALGNFRHGAELQPLVVMELKDSGVNLDRDRFSGRTAVQQCWDYLNALPDCPWGIVSNFVTFRLYHRAKGSQAYEEFNLQELRGDKRFAEFYCIFERGGLVHSWAGRPLRAAALLERTENRQREVDDKLYDEYSSERRRLIEHLHYKLGNDLDTSIYIAQRILDRIVFVAFCEDRDLLREKTLKSVYSTVPPFAKATNPRWRNFLELFRAMDRGHKNMPYLEVGFNGGLFKEDPRIDDLQLDDDWTEFFKSRRRLRLPRRGQRGGAGPPVREIGGRDREVAHRRPLRARPTIVNPNATMQKSAERKRFGTYYTPSDFTRLIVEETVRTVVRERFGGPAGSPRPYPRAERVGEPSPELAAYWRDCLAALRDIKACDPACGSGAFLIAAYDALDEEYAKVVDRLVLHEGSRCRRPGRRNPEHDPRRKPLRGGRVAAGGRNHAACPLAALRPARASDWPTFRRTLFGRTAS